MSSRDSTKQRWYAALWKAYEDAEPIDSVTSTIGELSADEAYDVQAMVVERKIRSGERIIGWKVGCTSRATMDQLNIDEPIFGCMTSGSHYSPLRAIKASDFCKPGIEGEIAFVMKRPLKGPGITTSDVIMAASGIMGAVELVDSRIRGWKMNSAEAIADNSLHGGVILGPFMRPISGFDLRHEGVVICKNGRLLASGCGVEALGNPVNVVAWLANTLSGFDREIEAGQIILTGSLTKFFLVEPGDVLDVSYAHLGSIHFSIGD